MMSKEHRPGDACCRFLALAVAWLLSVVAPPVGAAEANEARTVRDVIWVWGNPEMAQPGEQTLATYAQAGPARRAALLGVSNIVMGGYGVPDDDGAARTICADVAGCDRLVLKIKSDGEPVGGTAESGAPFEYDQTIPRIRRLADEFPQIRAVLLDDLSTVGLRCGFNAGFVREIRGMLPGKYEAVKIWGVVHDESVRGFIRPDRTTDYGLSDIIRELDVIAFSQWHAKDLVRLEENVAHIRELFPGKPIVLSLYLYDYGGNGRMPLDLLEAQCQAALKMAHAGVVEGIVFTGVINDPAALAWTADWIKRVGEQKLGAPAPPTATKRGPTEETPAPEPLKIDKFYFMFHPVCWSIKMAGDQPSQNVTANRKEFLDTWELEIEVVRRQKQFMTRMKPNEALVLFPVSNAKPMQIIEQYATKVLGRRCIIVGAIALSDMPPGWRNVPNAIEQFVRDELAGKDEWLQNVPAEIRTEVDAEIRQTCADRGYDWGFSAIEAAYTMRLWALQIADKLKERRLVYDPATTRSEAFGEGFEQCAMTWKAMLPHYLGMAEGAPNIYDLSVTGARFLNGAEFKERVALANDIYLYLWQAKDGRCVGFYARSQCLLNDPQYYAQVPLEGMTLELWVISNYGSKLYPSEATSLKPENGHMKVHVLNGIRRAGDGLLYIIGDDISYRDFRQRLIDAQITQ